MGCGFTGSRLRFGHERIPLPRIYISNFIVPCRFRWPWAETASARTGCGRESEVVAEKTLGDLLVDAKSKQIPPISSKHTVQQTIAHTPTGSSDMVVVQTKACS